MIGVGDYGSDEDNSYLRAWSASDVLLDSAYFFNPAGHSGGGYLSVSSAETIAYVTFWDEEPFAGAVYWDNITYAPAVPEPRDLCADGPGSGCAGLHGTPPSSSLIDDAAHCDSTRGASAPLFHVRALSAFGLRR